MKKILLLTMMCFFVLFGNVKAQETIEIGSSSLLVWSNPIADYFSHSVCQQIYTAEELQGKTGSINSITFEHGKGAPNTRNIVVYMKNIEKESFESNNDWIAISDEDIVYEGEWTLIGSTVNVIPMTIYLQKNFEYTGGDMLLCMHDKTGVGIPTQDYYNYFYCYGNENNRTLYYYTDNSNGLDMNNLSSYNGIRATYTNYLKLTFEGSGETPEVPTTIAAPQNLKATASATSIALTWDAVDGATSYEVYKNGDLCDIVGEPSFTATNLTTGTEYCFTVKALNDDLVSEFSDEVCATAQKNEDPDQPTSFTTIEIGEDKSPSAANNFHLPVYDFAQYALSQQIYTEEDFEDNLGSIYSVSFKLGNHRDAMVRQYEVYMKHTDLDVFEGAYVPMTEADKVFDGSVDISGQMDSWYKITFDKPFDYAGGNVVLCVYDKTGVKLQSTYHTFYRYNVDGYRAMYSQGNAPYDFSTLVSGVVLTYVNQVKFEIGSRPIVKVVPETIDLGEAMLGNYWTEKKAAQTVSVKSVSTTITNIESDNDFFVLPAEIDYTANPIVFEVAYDTEAEVEGDVTGNLIVTYADGVVEIPMTATAYAPKTGDVYELAKEITLENNKFNDNLTFSELHDNYVMPREVNDGKANDVVYSFEFEEEQIIIATVKGTNANLSIYDETFEGKGGPSNDNSFEGSVAVSSDFYYDFNDGFLIDWIAKDYDGDGYSWENTPYYGVDATNCVISYSSNTTNGILSANNVLMTENTYLITENSVLSFKAQCFDHSQYGVDHVKVEVSKDGESFTFIEEVTPGSLTYEQFTIDLGAKFETLGLEYGDYYIALRHQESDKMYVCVDNIQLSNNAKSKTRASEVSIYAVPYPAGKYYAVAAAESDFAFEMMIVNPDELPLAPTNVVATTIDEFSIELTWEASANSTSYNIYRNDEFVANVKELSYIDENLTHNTDYCYVVRGYNDILESVPSAKACAKTDKLVLDIPTNLTAVAESTTSIVLTWDAVEKAAGYKIYWGEDVIDIVSETTYTVEGLEPSTEYCYMVSAINKDVESVEKSDYACATTLDLVPSVPANLKVEATSTSSVVLTWDASTNAKRYYIYSADTLVAKTTYTTYNIVKLEYDTEYCFTVTAVNGEVESEESAEACGKTLGDGIEELASSINIYPNPVENELFLATEMNVESIAIYDIYGRLCCTDASNASTSNASTSNASTLNASTTGAMDTFNLPVQNLEAGVYFVKVVTSEGEIVKRFVKK